VITIANTNPLADSLEPWFKKLPQLPTNVVNVLFTYAPWIAIIFGIIGVLGALSAVSTFSMLAPFAFMGGASRFYGMGMVTTVGWLITSVLMVAAFPGLRAGRLNGWNLLFWSEVVSVVASLTTFSLGSIVGVAIGFYLLFQIKPKYR
jgi:hypothetical protein